VALNTLADSDDSGDVVFVIRQLGIRRT